MHHDHDDHIGTDFARWTRTQRLARMLTQEQLAERAGVSVRTVRNLEADRPRVPRLQTRRLIVAALSQPSHEFDGGRPAPAQLPADVADFVGRDGVLRRLDELRQARTGPPVSAPMLVVLTGPVGAGKTTLAVHWGHHIRPWLPDGQLFVDLRASTPDNLALPPFDGLVLILRGLGIPPREIPTDLESAKHLYRTLLADRRMLVILDDARDADQVRPLLPGGSANAVVVTSRDGMSGLVVREGAVRISVGGLAEAEAYALLAVVLGDERVAADPEATASVARQCGYLPLALRLVATTLDGRPRQSVADYAAAMRRAGIGDLSGARDLGLERLCAALTAEVSDPDAGQGSDGSETDARLPG